MTNITQVTNTVTAAVAARRGRKSIFEKRDALVSALRAIQNGETETRKVPSYFVQRRLAEAGLVQFTPVRSGGRGRPANTVSLTREGVATLAVL